MAQCPVCQSEIPDDFALIECGHCGAQLMVQFDGSVERVGVGAVAEDPQIEAEAVDALDLVAPPPDFSSDPDEDFPPPREKPGIPEEALSAGDEEPKEKPDIFADESLPPTEAQAMYRAPGATTNSPDLSDIARFGNSDASAGREGSLRYSLYIQGIDTVDVREALREALTDRKFLWDTDAILRSIRGGELTLENVGASKAYILVSRLRSLPVRVKWEQHALHQS